MTKQQIRWAAQHDWFITQHYTKPGAVVVRDDQHADTFQTFTDFQALRIWAGY